MIDINKLYQRTGIAVTCLGLMISLSGTACLADGKQSGWPQFLGPHRNGVSSETGLIDSFPESGPKLLWRVPGGVGMSGVAISDEKIVTLVQNAGKQWAIALNAANGKTLWKTAIAPAYRNSMGDGPRATPCIDGASVYVFTGEGILAALNLKNGTIIWSHNPLKELGGSIADYGMACSPMVVGNLVIVTPGARQAAIVAYDKSTGKLAWKSGTDTAGYSSPALLKVGGKQQIVAFTGKAVAGLAPKTGKLLWRFPYITDYDCNIATPIAVNGNVFISSGENHGSALLALTPSGNGFDVKTIWTSNGGGSVMRNEWQTSILKGDYLYGMDNVGGAGPVTNLNCVEAKTGKKIWSKRRFGKGNLIAADGKLFIVTMKGELVLVRMTPKGFEEISRSRQNLFGPTRQAPALLNGRLYVRDGKEILCFDVKRKK
ncbi:MAG: PQQ-like beta-propeller repeat protein [Planctomycetaceae bacterium]